MGRERAPHGSEDRRVLAARCELIDELGTGRNGTAFRAFDGVLGRIVAAKVMRDRSVTTVEGAAERAREMRTRFDHPNLVAPIDVFRDGDATVLLTEFYEYGSVEAVAVGFPDLAARWTSVMLTDVLAGLQALHGDGLVHGDLHAGNVLVANAGEDGLRFAVSDFGSTVAAPETHARGAASTLAPELWLGGIPSERSDLFALGMVARACLTAVAGGASIAGLSAVIDTLAAPDPADRPVTAEIALGLVQSLGPTRPQMGTPPAPVLPPLPEGWKPVVGSQHRRSAPAFEDDVPLIARAGELAQLEASWQKATAGEGSTVVIVGDAGTGKSRLVEEFAARVNDAIVLRCGAVDGGAPLDPWHALVVDAVDVLGTQAIEARLGTRTPPLAVHDPRLGGTTTSDGGAPDELQVALDALLRAAALESPTLVCVDDAQYAGHEDLETLVNLTRSLTDTRVLILVTSRPNPGVAAAFGDDVDTIGIGDLSDDAVEMLVASVMATADPAQIAAVTLRSGGNAYYAVELARAVTEDPAASVPESVADAVMSRVTALGADARSMLEVAATIGAEAEIEVIAATLDISTMEVHTLARRAEAARLLAPGDDKGSLIRFAHDLTRETLASVRPTEDRRHLHDQIGTVLAESAAEDPVVLLRAADQFLATADPDRRSHAASLVERAWARAVEQDLVEIATTAGVAAFDLAREARAASATPLGLEVGALAERRGQLDLAIRLFSDARETTRDELERIELDRRRAYALEKSGDYDGSLSLYRQTRAALDAIASDDEHRSVRAEVALGTAVTEFYRGNFSESRDLSVEGLTRAESCGDERLVAQACLQLEMVSSELGLADRETWATRALDLLRRLNDPIGLGNLLLNLGVSRYNDGDWQAALQMYRDAISTFDSAHDVIGAAIARNNEAELLTGQGRFRDAQWRLVEARRVFTAAGSTGYPMGAALTTSGLSRVMLHSGRTDEAARLLTRALELFGALDATNFVYDTRVREVELCLYSGALEKAESVAAAARALEADVGEVAIVPITLTRLLASVAWSRGDRDVAVALLQTAESEARRVRAVSEISLVLGALIDTRIRDDDATREELAVLNERLGVVWLPPVPTTA